MEPGKWNRRQNLVFSDQPNGRGTWVRLLDDVGVVVGANWLGPSAEGCRRRQSPDRPEVVEYDGVAGGRKRRWCCR